MRHRQFSSAFASSATRGEKALFLKKESRIGKAGFRRMTVCLRSAKGNYSRNAAKIAEEILAESFAIFAGNLLTNDRTALLMHVERQRVETTDSLAARTATFPATKDLDAGPGAGGRTGLTVGVDGSGLDVG